MVAKARAKRQGIAEGTGRTRKGSVRNCESPCARANNRQIIVRADPAGQFEEVLLHPANGRWKVQREQGYAVHPALRAFKTQRHYASRFRGRAGPAEAETRELKIDSYASTTLSCVNAPARCKPRFAMRCRAGAS